MGLASPVLLSVNGVEVTAACFNRPSRHFYRPPARTNAASAYWQNLWRVPGREKTQLYTEINVNIYRRIRVFLFLLHFFHIDGERALQSSHTARQLCVRRHLVAFRGSFTTKWVDVETWFYKMWSFYIFGTNIIMRAVFLSITSPKDAPNPTGAKLI